MTNNISSLFSNPLQKAQSWTPAVRHDFSWGSVVAISFLALTALSIIVNVFLSYRADRIRAENIVDDDSDYGDSLPLEDPNLELAIQNFQETSTYLGSNAVDQFLTRLFHGSDDAVYCNTFLMHQGIDQRNLEDTIRQIRERSNERTLYVPIILKSSWADTPLLNRFSVDHIVVLVITPDQSVEYYDSKGNDLNDETRTIRGTNYTPSGLARELVQSNFGEDEIQSQNYSRKAQTDTHNCGAFACRMIEDRLGHSFDDVLRDPLDVNSYRLAAAAYLGEGLLVD